MDTLGRHLLAEYHGCDTALLNDLEQISQLLHNAAAAANVRVVRSASHRYAPQGVTCALLIEESHLSIHTWPEHGYAAADFYTCGKGDPMAAHEAMIDGLQPERSEFMLLNRGTFPPGPSIQVKAHVASNDEHTEKPHGIEPPA